MRTAAAVVGTFSLLLVSGLVVLENDHSSTTRQAHPPRRTLGPPVSGLSKSGTQRDEPLAAETSTRLRPHEVRVPQSRTTQSPLTEGNAVAARGKQSGCSMRPQGACSKPASKTRRVVADCPKDGFPLCRDSPPATSPANAALTPGAPDCSPPEKPPCRTPTASKGSGRPRSTG